MSPFTSPDTGDQCSGTGPQPVNCLPEVSAKQDDDTAYRVAVTIKGLPPNPLVDFEVQSGTSGTGTITHIGQGAPTPGSPDTYENLWNPGNLSDGAYSLHAILYANCPQGVGTCNEVARASKNIYINNSGRGTVPANDPETQGETAGFTYPIDGGPAGYYKASNGKTFFLLDAVFSSGAVFGRTYYTTTPVGQDPTWQNCDEDDNGSNVQYVNPGSINRFSCPLNGKDTGDKVTGFAVMSNDTPGDPTQIFITQDFSNDDSGDAVRVRPYLQIPTALEATPRTQSVGPASGGGFPCSNNVAVRVTDQAQRPIQGVNVDVHAAGPDDQLAFDTAGADPPSANKPPDKNHTSSETAWKCSGSAIGAGGAQAEHNKPGDQLDVKHVESTGSGSNSSGEFSFRFHSFSGGGTQFTAWADATDDDTCVNEPSTDGSIGWGVPAPAVTGVLTDTCTSPPPPTCSPGASCSSPTTPNPPIDVTTILTIRYDHGDKAFEGRVRSGKPGCRAFRHVSLYKKRRHRKPDKFIDDATSSRKGKWFIHKRRPRGHFYAIVDPSSFSRNGQDYNCETDKSPTIAP
ncbi:MAG: hypothetical protein M3290_04535 [Actinomycetota bacterium]|nr:hypothetical protein [Actinomycetota bacterium]